MRTIALSAFGSKSLSTRAKDETGAPPSPWASSVKPPLLLHLTEKTFDSFTNTARF
jgi:hypothetical protein